MINIIDCYAKKQWGNVHNHLLGSIVDFFTEDFARCAIESYVGCNYWVLSYWSYWWGVSSGTQILWKQGSVHPFRRSRGWRVLLESRMNESYSAADAEDSKSCRSENRLFLLYKSWLQRAISYSRWRRQVLPNCGNGLGVERLVGSQIVA